LSIIIYLTQYAEALDFFIQIELTQKLQAQHISQLLGATDLQLRTDCLLIPLHM